MNASGLSGFRHSTDGRFNSDWGIVKMDGGRVTGGSFSPD